MPRTQRRSIKQKRLRKYSEAFLFVRPESKDLFCSTIVRKTQLS